tara:strand:+ start:602 stop:1861 length:1260 start_codon:yes stop_codon:yes gene_type:complete
MKILNYILYSFLLLISPIFIIIILIFFKLNFLIRFVPLTSDRIGHFAANTSIYFFEKTQIQLENKFKLIDFVFCQKNISNSYLKNLWETKIGLSNRQICYTMFCVLKLLSKKIKFFNKFYYDNFSLKIRDINQYIVNNNPVLSLTKDEETKGYNFLNSLGIKKNDKYVCIISRDEKYLSEVQNQYNEIKHSYRNIDIEKFSLAAQTLTERGYYVIRMGKRAEKKFSISEKNPKIIDYTFLSNKSDFLDIFIGSNCHFCLSSGCGFDEIPIIFKRPLALIEPQISKYRSYNNKVMHIFRKYLDLEKNRILNLSELLKKNIALITSGKDLIEKNVKLMEPDPQDILDLALDMDSFINQSFSLNSQDTENQKTFDNFYKANFNNISFKNYASKKTTQNWMLNENFIGKISSRYLVKNKWLLS